MKPMTRHLMTTLLATYVCVAGCDGTKKPGSLKTKPSKGSAAVTPSVPAGKSPAAPDLPPVAQKPKLWSIAYAPDMKARARPARDGARGAAVEFDKSTDERRMLAVAVPPGPAPASVKSLAVRYRLMLDTGATPTLCAVAYGPGSAAHFSVCSHPASVGDTVEELIPLDAPQPAAFSEGGDAPPAWAELEQLWVGLLMDEAARGSVEILEAKLSDRAWRPTRPLPLPIGTPKDWPLGHHQSVKATLETPDKTASESRRLDLSFTIPGHEHIWVTATRTNPLRGLRAYDGLRLTYRAFVPPGGVRILITLTESDGESHMHEPNVQAGESIRDTITIPFSEFRHAGWTKKTNGKLDANDIRSITLGMHGTAEDDTSSGRLTVSDVAFVPKP